MKKSLFTLVILLICTTSFFAYENADYLFRVLTTEAATETVSFSPVAEGIDAFHSVTDLHFQEQKAVYTTSGTIENNRITDYELTLAFSGQTITIRCRLEGDKIIYETTTTSGEISADEEIFILDNNIAWLWQLVYDYYKAEKKEHLTVFIPQLLVKDMTDTYDFTFEQTSEVEGMSNVYFTLNGQSGMLKVDGSGKVTMMLMAGVIMERVE
ncbi:MAG TPA: hypothetical protein PLO84_04015 [Thermotogota bacterium]|nr:hypothetical protein [Thermotogota bacterium]HPJ88264.1 hypothetical protein [Thermotogota bacterium]